MPVKLAHMIQAGLPTMSFGSMAQVMADTPGRRRSATR